VASDQSLATQHRTARDAQVAGRFVLHWSLGDNTRMSKGPKDTRLQGASAGEQWTVRFDEAETRAAFDPSEGQSRGIVYVQAHGAGGSMDDRSTLAAGRALRGCGLDVVRFNFLYREKGSSRPDLMPKLQACYAAVVDSVRARLRPKCLLLGGRSMGGRAASMMAAEGFACDGLILLAYPLHPPGQPEKLRDAHLARIGVPVLCFNGTRDDFCRRDLMDAVVARLSHTFTMHWLDAADHSFRVPKSSGRTEGDVLAEVAWATVKWLDALVAGGR
jgi:predicted alpha/beta-hydrolase family hydrolase